LGGAATGIPKERRYARQRRENHGVQQDERGGGMREPSGPAEPDTVIGRVKNDGGSGESSRPMGVEKGTFGLATSGRWSKLSARAIADRPRSATVLRVLAAIGIYASREGIAWPSQDTIATVAGID